MNAFALLNTVIQGVLGKTFSYLTPTEPQELAIPLILEGKDVLLIAPTGSGKTEAAILPVFHKLLEYRRECGGKEKEKKKEVEKGIFAIYITPLRALNRDLLSRIEKWSAELDISIQVRHGDTTKNERRKQALAPPDILITTPETIQAIIPGKRMRENLKSVRHVIIDEVHELVSSKRGSQLSLALARISAITGNFQRVCLSATVGNPEAVAKFFSGTKKMQIVNTFLPKMLKIEVLNPQKTKEDELLAKQLSAEPEVKAHIRVICEELKLKRKRSLIFVNTRRAAEMLGSFINKIEPNLISVHHGSLSKETRMEAEDKLKRGEIKGLICTSSMELGIDIGSVDMVIQYASPRQVTRIVQRVGRASHFVEKTSKGKIIALTPDDVAESLIIAKRARLGKIEEIKLKEASMDVLANQICGILLDFSVISIEELHALIKKTYPFQNTSLEKIQRIIEKLEKDGLVKREEFAEGRIKKSKSTRSYYYENLSMIPDERKYEIYDIVTSKKICTLDELFVLNFAALNALFVAKGEIWSIVDVDFDADKINVEPCGDKKGEIPNWEGEEIPVPFEVAQEVGVLRGEIASSFSPSSHNFEAECGRSEKICLKLKEEFGDESMECMKMKHFVEYIKKQLDAFYPVPTDKHIIVEVVEGGKEIVINACFGHLVNETLGRLLSSLLGAKLGTDISMETDPYRIKLKSDRKVKKGEIESVFSSIKPEYAKPIIDKTLRNSYLFKWEVLNVAKRFGTLRRDFDRNFPMDKLIKTLENTPIQEEAIKNIFEDKLDMERTEEVILKLKTGEIKVSFFYSLNPSPIGLSGYLGWRDVLVSKEESLIVEALRNRIMNDRVTLFCMSCNKWKKTRMVKTIFEMGEEGLRCPFCNSKLIAALKPWEKEEISIVKRNTASKEEKKRLKRLYRNANLVLSHGTFAVIALSARGIGPEVASRIIRNSKDRENDFYRNILEEERKYTRTKRFWD